MGYQLMKPLMLLNGAFEGGFPQLYVSDGRLCLAGTEMDEPPGFFERSSNLRISSLLEYGQLDNFLEYSVDFFNDCNSKIRIEDLEIYSPIDETAKILCAGFNYYKHNTELRTSKPSIPYFFQRVFSTVTGPYEPILKNRVSKKMDYEVELAIMIGKMGRNIPTERASEHIAGYFVANDVSFRDFQFNEYNQDITKTFGQNWLYGKNMDRSFPSGPWLLPKQMCTNEYFEIETRVNGVLVQHSSTKEMIYDVHELIHFASQGITLKPGDVISTGTPEGTAAGGGHDFLVEGDVIEGKIKEIGSIKNKVVHDNA